MQEKVNTPKLVEGATSSLSITSMQIKGKCFIMDSNTKMKTEESMNGLFLDTQQPKAYRDLGLSQFLLMTRFCSLSDEKFTHRQAQIGRGEDTSSTANEEKQR